jgi:hypothetical protein
MLAMSAKNVAPNAPVTLPLKTSNAGPHLPSIVVLTADAAVNSSASSPSTLATAVPYNANTAW